ncbi:MAG: DMT family transporter [Geminicoccaceae bacterium]|nr:DMT family transporter [Geminicoccaceae bacterium]MCS7267757.1 DMT family transporter [Geminicoccaceae bacterium]MDW8124311.1 DMT family transporter [Geminicoccaceae bacterium]
MTGSPALAAPVHATGRAVLAALASYACFSVADALVKLAASRYPVEQIALLSSLFALVPVFFLARASGGVRALLPNNLALVAARGLLTALCALCAWRAFALMPLADAYALLFLAPILFTALSALLLGEPVGWRRWCASAVGFAGVLLMVRPDFATLGLGHALALLAAALGAAALTVLKRIGNSETSAAVLFALFSAIGVVAAPGAVLSWRPLDLAGLWPVALAGLLFGSAQAALVLATREAPASVVAPFQYTQMLWAVLLGLWIFGDRPSPELFAGMALVAGSGLYTLWREKLRRGTVSLGAARGEVPARTAR